MFIDGTPSLLEDYGHMSIPYLHKLTLGQYVLTPHLFYLLNLLYKIYSWSGGDWKRSSGDHEDGKYLEQLSIRGGHSRVADRFFYVCIYVLLYIPSLLGSLIVVTVLY